MDFTNNLLSNDDNDFDIEQKSLFFATIKDTPELHLISSDYDEYYFLTPNMQKETKQSIAEQAYSHSRKQKNIKKKNIRLQKLSKNNQKLGFCLEKNKKTKSANGKQKDYTKNICTYISNHIIEQFLTEGNGRCTSITKKISEYLQINRQDLIKFYLQKRKDIRGIYTLRQNIIESDIEDLKDNEDIYKLGFSIFFVWYLRNCYMRYLITDGRMKNPQIYIQYKNNQLLPLFGSIVYQRLHTLFGQYLQFQY